MIIPYLTFDGNCEEAMKLYMEVFGGEIEGMEFITNPANGKKMVLHCQVKLLGESRISAGDATWDYTKGNSMSLNVMLQKEEDVRRAWDLLAEGGQVIMALQPMDFAKLHGTVQDKYGFSWILSAADSAYEIDLD